MEKGVEVFQIETRNPHFHEDKGMAHMNEMLEASLATIHGSKVCPDELKESLPDQLRHLSKNKRVDYGKKYRMIE